ncbi:MAG: DUF4112 domain-containing protein [Ferruginibacter sp.]
MPVRSKQRSVLSNLDSLSKLMDSRFIIPGTNIRFGLDSLIGLVPGAGDFATFLLSGFMVMILAKNGASGFVLARMTFNILIDALIGSIPILGDIFDVAFKANQRNMKLMREHYIEGRHKGGAWKLILPLMLVLFICVATLAWLSYKLFVWLFT